MSYRYSFKSAFQKSFDELSEESKQLVLKALEAINLYLKTGHASYGLRIKKLHETSRSKTLEARVNLALRVIWVQTKDEIVFALLGNHDEVRRFINRF